MVSKMGDSRLRTDYAVRVARGEDKQGLLARMLRLLTFGYLSSPPSARNNIAENEPQELSEMSVDELQDAITRQYNKITPK